MAKSKVRTPEKLKIKMGLPNRHPLSFVEGSRPILIPMDLVLADFDDAGLWEHLFARDGTIEPIDADFILHDAKDAEFTDAKAMRGAIEADEVADGDAEFDDGDDTDRDVGGDRVHQFVAAAMFQLLDEEGKTHDLRPHVLDDGIHGEGKAD